MLIQEKRSGPETLLKLYVAAIDEELKALRPHLQAKHLPRDSSEKAGLTKRPPWFGG